MIGQLNVLSQVDIWIKNNTIPKFLIIQGIEGMGKKTLLSYISEKTGYPLIYFTNKIDGVRELIDICYNQTKPIIYAIADCDKMSNQAENALLKIAEEPPKNAYIAITTNSDSLLPTIKSRGVQIVMENYTLKDKEQYVKEVLHIDLDTRVKEEIEVSDTLYDINIFERCDFNRLCELCENIVKQINKTNIGSALKISNNINVKDKDSVEGFDLGLFLKVLAQKYYLYYINNDRNKRNLEAYQHILNAKKQLSRSYNKQYILDELLIKLQENVV